MNKIDQASTGVWTARLQVVTCLVVLSVCGVILTDRYFPNESSIPRGPAEGDRVEALAALVPDGSERAFVLVLSPTCGFCEKSLPAFKRLVASRDSAGSNVAVAAAVASPDQLEAEASVLESAGLAVDLLRAVDVATFEFPGFPTTVLVDRDGIVHGSWVGLMDESRVVELIRHL